MNYLRYNELIDELIEEARQVSKAKGADYTIGSSDALKNFKAVAERTGLDAKKVLAIYMMKHQDAISNYIKSNGQSESEPIKMRIIDNINYLCLLWGLITEDQEQEDSKNEDYENQFSESKRKAITTENRPETVNIVPDTDGKGYQVHFDGSKRNGHTIVRESGGTYTVRHRSEEPGEAEYLERFDSGGRKLTEGKDTPSSVQEEQEQDIRVSRTR